MWIVLTLVSLSFGGPPGVHAVTSTNDSAQSQVQDTVRSGDSGVPQKTVLRQERPYPKTNTPLNRLQEPRADGKPGAALDSLLETNPPFKASLLKELLIPSSPVTSFLPISPIETFNQQMAQYAKLTPFERMGLIAKRYNLYYPPGKTIKDYQIDILRTVRWLNEVLQ